MAGKVSKIATSGFCNWPIRIVPRLCAGDGEQLDRKVTLRPVADRHLAAGVFFRENDHPWI